MTGAQANPIFTSTSQARSVQVEKCRKQKSTDKANEKFNKREVKKRSSEESPQGCSDYLWQDGGQNADDVNTDLPPEYLKDLIMAFYETQVMADEIEIHKTRVPTKAQDTERWRRITASHISKWRASTKVAKAVNICTPPSMALQQQDRGSRNLGHDQSTSSKSLQALKCKCQGWSWVSHTCGLLPVLMV